MKKINCSLRQTVKIVTQLLHKKQNLQCYFSDKSGAVFEPRLYILVFFRHEISVKTLMQKANIPAFVLLLRLLNNI